MNRSTNHQGLRLWKVMRVMLLVALLAASFGVSGGVEAAPQRLAGGDPQVTVGESRVSVAWQVPDVALVANAEGALDVFMTGVERAGLPGQALLPVKSLLVALPPVGSPRVVVSGTRSRVEALKAPLSTAPAVLGINESSPVGDKTAQLAYLDEIGVVRGVRLARLVMQPVMVNQGVLEVYAQICAEIVFDAPVAPTPVGDDVLIEQVRASVINPGQVQSTLGKVQLDAAAPVTADVALPKMAMQIEQAGMYSVSFADLTAAGFPAASVGDPKKLHVTHAGQEVAVEQVGDGDATFESGEAIRFYASPRLQRYSTYDTYFLAVGASDAPVIGTRSAAPGAAAAGVVEAEKLFEQNGFYPFLDPIYTMPEAGRDGDRWMWHQIITGQEVNIAFDLGNVDGGQVSSITVYANGKTVYTHNLAVKINNQSIGSISWTGAKAKAQTLGVGSGVLADTGNSLNLGVSGTGAGIWLDAFKMRYRVDSTVFSGDAAIFGEPNVLRKYTVNLNNAANALVYDVSVPHAPVRLTGWSNPTTSSLAFQDNPGATAAAYLAATQVRAVAGSNLRISPAMQAAPVGGAQYLIISHPNFSAGVAALATHRTSKGLKVHTENVQAIFDQYGEGLPTPQSIRAYLADAYKWSTAPQYVLLVGDGTWDPKHYKSPTPSFIPPFLTLISQGEYAADNRYVTLDGDDIMPDMMIGRLPVNDTTQLSTVISKIINYENNPPTGDWRKRGTLIADHPFTTYNDYDFVILSETLASKMGFVPIIKQKIYYKVNYLTGNAARDAIVAAVNTGTSIVTYAGHATWHQWGGRVVPNEDPNETIFEYDPNNESNNDLRLLTNGNRLPVLFEMTCETSRFDAPDFDTIDEMLMRKSGGGTIFSFGPTSPGYGGSHEKLGIGFMGNLKTGTATAGSTMNAAKLYLRLTDPNFFLVDTYLVLGDPAVKIQIENIPTYGMYLPYIRK